MPTGIYSRSMKKNDFDSKLNIIKKRKQYV